MAYKIKTKSRKFPAEYWEKRELIEVKKKYPNRNLPFSVIVKEGVRDISGIPRKIHREGANVYYQNKLAKIRRVTKAGLWIEPYEKATDKSISYPSGRVVFIPEHQAEQKVFPITTNFPIYVNPLFVMKD
jgi:hypothetical protein